jgi:RimJ/RimL family protein N-acetyltransferase
MDLEKLFFATIRPAINTQQHDLPDPYTVEFWSPRGLDIVPERLALMPFAVWSVMFHHGRIFRNRGYQLLLIRKRGELVHRSCIFPGYFRFPFMAASDLQVGDTWTEPAERGKGLALWALSTVIRRMTINGETVWYICDKDNTASARVAEKAGMRLVGRGERTRRFGLNLLGRFQITEEVVAVDEQCEQSSRSRRLFAKGRLRRCLMQRQG